MKAATA
jgi:transposase